MVPRNSMKIGGFCLEIVLTSKSKLTIVKSVDKAPVVLAFLESD